MLLSEDCGPLTVDPRDSLRSIIGLCVLSIYFLCATKQSDVGEIKILSYENSILISANHKNTLISCASKLLLYYVSGIKIVLAKERKRSFGKIFIELELLFQGKISTRSFVSREAYSIAAIMSSRTNEGY